MSKAMKEISAIEKANKNLRRYFLATIYVLFVIPHLDMAMKVSLKNLQNSTNPTLTSTSAIAKLLRIRF